MRKLPPLGGLGRLVFAFLAIAGGLAAYYYLSSSNKEAELERRNLRLLGLASRQVASSINGLEGIFRNTSMPLGSKFKGEPIPREDGAADGVSAADLAAADIEAAGRLVNHLRVEAGVAPATELAEVPECGNSDGHEVVLDRARLELQQRCAIAARRILVRGRTDLNEFLLPMLESDAFDEVLLIDSSGSILLHNGRGLLIARQLDLPPALLIPADEVAVSEDLLGAFSRSAEIQAGGNSFKFFLQPVLGVSSHLGAGQLALVGLTERSRFRSESNTIDPNKLLLIVLLLVLVVLTMPFVKFTAMGATDAVGLRDVLFFFFSLVMAAGVLTLALIDYHWYQSLCSDMDQQVSELAERIDDNFQHEIGELLDELEAQNENFEAPDDGAKPLIEVDFPRGRLASYPYLEMVAWIDQTGLQRAKRTTRTAATPIVSIASREAFQRVREGRLWALPADRQDDSDRTPSRRFSIESIRSRNTGQELVMVAVPYPDEERPGWAAIIIARALSVNDAKLPHGYGFMIVRPDGEVLFHSQPERNLRENLFEATENEPLLRSAVSGRVERSMSLEYRGAGVRMFTRPIEVGDLTIVTFADKRLLRTINFETVAFTASLFGFFLTLVLLLFVVYSLFASRAGVRWVWPDRKHPIKYLAVLGVELATLLLFLILHPLAPRLLLPVTLALPFVALGFSILILSREVERTARLELLALAMVALAALFNLFAILRLESYVALVFFAGHLLVCWWFLKLPGRASPRVRAWVGERGRSLYVTAGLGMLVLAGMMTAATFFRIVHFDHARLLLRRGQLEMAQAMDARHLDLKNSYGSPEELSQELLAARLCDDRVDEVTGERIEARDLYFEPYFDTLFLADYPERHEQLCGSLDLERFNADSELREGFDRSADVHKLLAEYMPFYDGVSVDTRLLYQHQSDDGKWSWWRVPRAKRAASSGTHPFYLEYAARGAASGGGATYHLVSNSPALNWPKSAVWWLSVLASILGVLAALRFVVRRVFLLDVEVPDPVEPERLFRDGATIPMLLLCPPLSDQTELLRTAGIDPEEIVDARRLLDEGELAEPEPAGENERIPLFVIHPGGVLAGRETNGRLLTWLERALATQGRVVIMACGRRAEADYFLPETPLEQPKNTEEDGEATPPDPRADPLFDRWNEVLSRFSRVQTQIRSDTSHFETRSTEDLQRLRGRLGSDSDALLEASRLEKFGELLRSECIVNPRLQQIGLRILRLPGIERRTRSEVLEAVRLAADGYYRALWNTLSDAERLTAAQLAHGRLVNYKAGGAFRTLAQKRIIELRPNPELMNKSFTRWVRDEAQPEKVEAWEGAPGPSIWQQLKGPIYLGVLGAAAFLFLTQRALFQSTLAFTSALTAALPLVFRIIDRMQVSPKPGSER